MIAFHGNEAIQQEYLARVLAHKLADEIVQGQYWQNGRGCAVGCTIHGSDHDRYETELGIPTGLAYLQDRIFEGLPYEDAKEFPLQFLSAVPVGADLRHVTAHFLIWLLTDETHGVIRFAREDGEAAIQTVVALYTRRLNGDEPTDQEWQSADEAAGYAAGYAADEAARAARAAGYAARAGYAGYAARAARAARAGYAAEAAGIAGGIAARAAVYQQMRDKLLILLAEAPVTQKNAALQQ